MPSRLGQLSAWNAARYTCVQGRMETRLRVSRGVLVLWCFVLSVVRLCTPVGAAGAADVLRSCDDVNAVTSCLFVGSLAGIASSLFC
jgi:hypothetical protein